MGSPFKADRRKNVPALLFPSSPRNQFAEIVTETQCQGNIKEPTRIITLKLNSCISDPLSSLPPSSSSPSPFPLPRFHSVSHFHSLQFPKKKFNETKMTTTTKKKRKEKKKERKKERFN